MNWKIWCKALGQKASNCDKESDMVACVRTFIFMTYLITNCFIVAGVIRHWNDETQILIEIHEAQPTIPMVTTKMARNGVFE